MIHGFHLHDSQTSTHPSYLYSWFHTSFGHRSSPPVSVIDKSKEVQKLSECKMISGQQYSDKSYNQAFIELRHSKTVPFSLERCKNILSWTACSVDKHALTGENRDSNNSTSMIVFHMLLSIACARSTCASTVPQVSWRGPLLG